VFNTDAHTLDTLFIFSVSRTKYYQVPQVMARAEQNMEWKHGNFAGQFTVTAANRHQTSYMYTAVFVTRYITSYMIHRESILMLIKLLPVSVILR
jgi:hypothetical protein